MGKFAFASMIFLYVLSFENLRSEVSSADLFAEICNEIKLLSSQGFKQDFIYCTGILRPQSFLHTGCIYTPIAFMYQLLSSINSSSVF